MDALTRTLPPTRRVLGDVDPVQPLDTTHPLTGGLRACWLPLPQFTGGSTLYDISSHQKHAAINNAAVVEWGASEEWMFPTFDAPGGGAGGETTASRSYSEWSALAAHIPTGRDQIFSGVRRRIWFVAGDENGTPYKFFDGSTEAPFFSASLGELNIAAIRISGGTVNIKSLESENTFSYSGTTTISSGDVLLIGKDGFQNSSAELGALLFWERYLSDEEVERGLIQARRGFPGLLNRRDSVGLLGDPISGTAAITDGSEIISATGQTEVSGTLSVTDRSETLAVEGATIVSGAASITEAAEDVSATGEVKIAGTASLADGTQEVVIVGQNDVTGSLSFADLAAEIAATGAVEVRGSLALTDAGESISVRQRIPARLATVDVRLEDIIIVDAKLTD